MNSIGVLLNEQTVLLSGTNTADFMLPVLASGLYMFVVQVDDEVFVQKVIIQ
jgi:hypothetical protein